MTIDSNNYPNIRQLVILCFQGKCIFGIFNKNQMFDEAEICQGCYFAKGDEQVYKINYKMRSRILFTHRRLVHLKNRLFEYLVFPVWPSMWMQTTDSEG